jgi:hypothetical protein
VAQALEAAGVGVDHMNELYPDNVLKIPNHIPGATAAQYMFRHKQKQWNLCGQFCVAYCMQDEAHTDNIDDFLDYWEAVDLKWYQSAFKNGLGRTTGLYDLDKMLAAYGNETPAVRWNKADQSPLGVGIVLEQYQAIIGVNIDWTGYLVGSGIRHWVVLDGVEALDNQYAICRIYNPFTNNIRPFSWKEVQTSMGAYKQGIWIPR